MYVEGCVGGLVGEMSEERKALVRKVGKEGQRKWRGRQKERKREKKREGEEERGEGREKRSEGGRKGEGKEGK